MSQLEERRPVETSADHRAPGAVWAAAIVTTLLTIVTSYGAVYFSFFHGNPNPGLGSWAFAAVFLAINAVAATAAVGLVRGSGHARAALAGYGVLGVLWCVAKLVFWSETESLVFGVLNVVVLCLLLTSAVRRHTA